MECIVCKTEIDEGLFCDVCAVYSSVPSALKLYDLLKDQVQYQGDMCLNTCPMFNSCVLGKRIRSNHGVFSSVVVYRSDFCIDIFGE